MRVLFILGRHGQPEFIHTISLHEIYGTSAKSSASHSRSNQARLYAGDPDHQI